MIARAVHHVSLTVRDVEASRAFYEGLLGLATIERPDLGLPGVWYQSGAAQIHLIQAPEGADTGRPPGSLTPLANHLAFEIDDYEKVLDTLEARNVEVVRTSPGIGQMWIRDPDGHVIELTVPRTA
jgi:catechol 2,3-dioxygenase-like lactoylglutathione lyase family enzyme